ncbi:MAG: flavodoxin family protein [Spirochaetota bacterium]
MRGLKNTDPQVLAIYGSPRKEGVTASVQNSILEQLGLPVYIKKFYVYDENINPCVACGYCKHHFGCIYNDSMTDIYDSLITANLVCIASPLYFSNITGPLKLLIDRCQVIWERQLRGEKSSIFQKGFFTAAGAGSYSKMFVPSVITIRHLFNTAGLIYNEDEYVLIDSAPPLLNLPGSPLMKKVKSAAAVLTKDLKQHCL